MDNLLVRRGNLFAQPYWKSLSPDIHAKFSTPSRVVETIAPISRLALSSCLVVCSGGELLELEGDLTTVIRHAKLAMLFQLAYETRINHAAFDMAKNRLYVNAEVHTTRLSDIGSLIATQIANKLLVGHESGKSRKKEVGEALELSLPATSIFVADLRTLFDKGTHVEPVILAPFFTPADTNMPRRVEGLAVEPMSQLIFACDEKNERLCIWPSEPPLDRQIFVHGSANVAVPKARPCGLVTMADRPFRPFRCATMQNGVVKINGVKTCCLAVADYYNSRVYIFEIIARTLPDDDDVVNSITATLLRTIATKGFSTGQVLFPRGISFDWAGNLLVADYGNSRIQIFGPNAFPKQQSMAAAKPRRKSMKRASFISSLLSMKLNYYDESRSSSPSSSSTSSPNSSPLSLSPAVARSNLLFAETITTDTWRQGGGEDVTKFRLCAVWQSSKVPKLVSACALLDPETRQPIILAGLCDTGEVASYAS